MEQELQAIFEELGLLLGDGAWGDTRDGSQGYRGAMGDLESKIDLGPLKAKYPNWEFVTRFYCGSTKICYRAKGTRGIYHAG